MTTLRKWFDAFTAATGETPTAIVIATGDRWDCPPVDPIAFDDVSAEVLDEEFDDGYGGNNSPNLCAWSESFVLFSDDYDGAESLCWVPRNPTTHVPLRPGGG